MENVKFENKRWEKKNQGLNFMHRKALELIDSGEVLDLGCGDGFLLEKLEEKGIIGVGVDFSEAAAEKCRTKGIEIKLYDLTKTPLPFRNKTFQYVVALDVLEHLYFPENLLKEMVRISKEYVVISVPNFNSLSARLQMLLGRAPENNIPKKGHIYWFNHNILNKMLKENGLASVDVRINSYKENIFVAGKLFKLLAKWWPALFALSFVVRAKIIS